MRTIIAGSRKGFGYADVVRAVRASGWWDDISVVLCGAARGVDTWGEAWALDNGREVEQWPADWQRHGRAAGPVRNRQMADNAEALLAVWDGRSRGTAHMIAEARKRKLRVFVYQSPPPSS